MLIVPVLGRITQAYVLSWLGRQASLIGHPQALWKTLSPKTKLLVLEKWQLRLSSLLHTHTYSCMHTLIYTNTYTHVCTHTYNIVSDVDRQSCTTHHIEEERGNCLGIQQIRVPVTLITSLGHVLKCSFSTFLLGLMTLGRKWHCSCSKQHCTAITGSTQRPGPLSQCLSCGDKMTGCTDNCAINDIVENLFCTY